MGIDAIALLRSQRPALTVGAGTVLAAAQFEAVLAAGAQFVVTPGCTDELLQCGLEAAVPLLPGIATASELMSGYRLGYRRFKLFPAQILGGVGLLRAFAGPFRDVRFCPTGGVSQANLAEYLALPNVMAVGGSWVAPAELVAQQRWGEITALARAAGRSAAPEAAAEARFQGLLGSTKPSGLITSTSHDTESSKRSAV